MKKSLPTTSHTITLSDGWTIPAESGVGRRTLVKGAAWTVPVVAISTATPAAAASATPTLAFTQSSYSGTACGTISGVQVKRTTDGSAPDSGKVARVTLKDGYTFADGSTGYSGTTDANGLVALPDIKVPSKGGKSAFGATSDSLSASAPVSADPTAASGLYVYKASTGKTTTDPVSNSAKAIKIVSVSTSGALVFQNSDGSIHGDDGTAEKDTASGVNTGTGLVSIRTVGNDQVWYKKSDGLYTYDAGAGTVSGPIKNSADAIKVISSPGRGSLVFQNSDGSIHGDDGEVQTETKSGVDTGADLVSIRTNGDADQVWYKKSDGLYTYNATTKAVSGPVANSKDAIKVISMPGRGSLVFQNSDGSIHGDDGALQTGTDSGVDTGAGLVAIRTIDGADEVWYKKSDGLYRYNASTRVVSGPVKNSADAIRIITNPSSGGLVFQNSDGSIHGDDGTVQPGTESGVDTGAGLVSIRLISGNHEVWYKKSPACG